MVGELFVTVLRRAGHRRGDRFRAGLGDADRHRRARLRHSLSLIAAVAVTSAAFFLVVIGMALQGAQAAGGERAARS